jgi:hypothetical protein
VKATASRAARPTAVRRFDVDLERPEG